MIAIILCAGFGTRLYPLTLETPKALLDVAGRPVIDYLIDQMLHFSPLETVHVVCNDRFFDHFLQWRQQSTLRVRGHGKKIVVHNDGRKDHQQRLGAIGDLAFVLDRVDLDQGAVIAACDNIYLANLLPIWRRFVGSQENVIPVIRQDDTSKLQRTGVAILGPGDRVIGFEEKPAEPPSPWSCPPLYFLNSRTLNKSKEFASQPEPPDGIGYLIRYLVGEETIYALKIEAGRLDVGDPAGYENARRVLAVRAVYNALPRHPKNQTTAPDDRGVFL